MRKHLRTQTGALLALLLFLTASTGLLPGADSVIVFNEIHYHPSNEDNDPEWVELHSLMGVDVDISGWELEGGINYLFANGTVVPGQKWYKPPLSRWMMSVCLAISFCCC